MNYEVFRYKNPTTLRGRKPVRMRMRGWSLYKTLENLGSEKPKKIATEWSITLGCNITYRTVKGSFGSKDLELWVSNE